jgi:hypothetical protein
MSLGFIAVVALVLGAALPAWADIAWNGIWAAGPKNSSTTVSFATLDYNGSNLPNVINQTAGDVTVTGDFRVDHSSGTTTYNLSGGSLTFSKNSPYGMGGGSGINFVMNVSGTATFNCTTSGDKYFGDWGGGGTATWNFTGTGNLSLTGNVQFGQGNSYLKVTGGGHMINMTTVQTNGHAIGGLTFTLDSSAGHISPINVGSGWFELAGSAGLVDIATSGFSPYVGETFDLIKIPTAGGISTPSNVANNLLNAGDTTDWKLTLVEGEGGKDILRLTALTPEPATMALLAIGGVGMLIRRRRHG